MIKFIHFRYTFFEFGSICDVLPIPAIERKNISIAS